MDAESGQRDELTCQQKLLEPPCWTGDWQDNIRRPVLVDWFTQTLMAVALIAGEALLQE